MAAIELPSVVDIEGDHVIVGKLSGELPKRAVEPAGRFFQAYFHRKRHNRTISEQETIDKSNAVKDVDDEELSEDEVETKDLLSLDPKYWKEQDHYAVLGLSRLRWKATEEDIKKAFRKKVLKHHPDKKAAKHGGRTDDDSFFKCVQKAYDLLLDPEKRRQFDSVDPTFKEEIPSAKKEIKPADFFKVYGPVFERNARFSKKQPVPLLGDENSTLEEVEAFYDFWYNFDSWRVFNYKDEEEGSGGDDKNRDDKRYLDKKNKKQREELKTEDNKRLRRLVDQALALDARIKRLRQEEKERKLREKEAKKQAKDEPKASAESAVNGTVASAKDKEEEKLKKEEEEKKAKAEKEAKKKQIQKERKVFRRVLKSRNYFLPPNATSDSRDMVDAVTRSETIASDLPLEELTALNAAMVAAPREAWKTYMAVVSRLFGESAVTPEPEYVEPAAIEDEDDAKTTTKPSTAAAAAAKPATVAVVPAAKPAAEETKKPVAVVAEQKKKEEPKKEEQKNHVEPAKVEKKEEKKKAEPEAEKVEKKEETKTVWSDKEVALLIEAVKKFPGGTISRWQKITKFINEHNVGGEPKKEKEVADKTKQIQNMAGFATPTETHLKVEKKHNDTVINDKPTERDTVDTDAAHASSSSSKKKTEANGDSNKKSTVTVEELALDDWTKEQMEALQAGLRQFPPESENRWDRITELVPGKNKKEVMSRYKKIALKLKEKQGTA